MTIEGEAVSMWEGKPWKVSQWEGVRSLGSGFSSLLSPAVLGASLLHQGSQTRFISYVN